MSPVNCLVGLSENSCNLKISGEVRYAADVMRYGRPELLFFALPLLSAANAHAQLTSDSPKYLGHAVRIIEPQHDVDGFPKGPASVCVEVLTRPQCYTAPVAFGNNTAVEIVQLTANEPAILFSAESGGVSGWGVHFALLQLGQRKELDNLFPSGLSVSNQHQYDFFDERTLSRTKIFVTADYVWGPDEGHFGAHRFIISTYRRKEPLYPGNEDRDYFLEDRYMTARKYDLDANPNLDILASEKQEVVARLTRARDEGLRYRKSVRP